MENTLQDRIERLEAAVEDIATAVLRIDRQVDKVGEVLGYMLRAADAPEPEPEPVKPEPLVGVGTTYSQTPAGQSMA